MGVASWLLILLGLLNGSGPAGGPALAEGLGGRPCLVGLFSRVGLVCLVFGVGDTPAAACWVVVGAPACVGVACCRGSGAVRPGCLARVLLSCVGGGSRVWVGWL